MNKKRVIETPLSAPDAEGVKDNLRFLLWCCRAVELKGLDPIASHLVKPWYLNDAHPLERQKGMDSEWCWQGDPHMFFTDRGTSTGMQWASDQCEVMKIPVQHETLREYAPASWEAFKKGTWPPHTKGFRVA